MYWVHSAPEDFDLDDDGLRECARGRHCTDPRLSEENGRTVQRPALTPRPFCEADRGVVSRQLDELPSYWQRVHAEIGNKSQARGPKVSMSKSAPVPINLAVDSLLREVSYTLHSWETRVRHAARLAPEPAASVHRAVKVLSGHLDTLLSLPMEPMTRTAELRALAQGLPANATGEGTVHLGGEWAEVVLDMGGADAGLEILELHYRCRSLLQETRPPAVHLPVPCGECGHKRLYERRTDDGTPDGATCRHCGHRYTDNEVALLWAGAYAVAEVRAEAGEGRRRVPVPAVTDDDVTRRA